MQFTDPYDSFALNVEFTDKPRTVPVVMKENGNIWTQSVTHKDSIGCTCSVDTMEDMNIMKYAHWPLKQLMKSCSLLRNLTSLEAYVK